MNQKDLDIANNQLIMSAKHGVIEGVKDALSNGADINHVTKWNNTALLFVAREKDIKDPVKHEELMSYLILNGADCRVLDNEQKQKYAKEIRMVNAGRQIFSSEEDSQLIQAVKNNNLEYVKKALDNGADINTKDGMGNTPLFIAASCDYEEVALELVALGADINMANHYGGTALSVSAYKKNREDIVKALFNAGADYSVLSDKAKEEYAGEISEAKAKAAKINKIIRQKKQKNFRDFARSRTNRNR